MDSVIDTPEPLGQVLAAERERQGLSRADVAQRLHMSPLQVEALEAGDYARLPRGTFLRGFVRNYSRLLGLDADAALGRLAEVVPQDQAPGIVVPSQNIRFDPLGDRFSSPLVKAVGLSVVAVGLAFAAMYWWLFIRPPAPSEPVLASTAPAPRNLAHTPLVPPDPVATRDAPKLEPSAEPSAEPPIEPLPMPVAPPAAAKPAEAAKPQPVAAVAGARTLSFTFRGESWVEVRERGGRVVFQQLNAPGTTAQVTGRPPLQVTIGNAPEVALAYEGRDFALEPHTKVAVARFTLE